MSTARARAEGRAQPRPVRRAFPSNAGMQIAFVVVIALLLAAHLGTIVRVLYPLGALLLAMRLLATSTADYVSFVIWLWALSPLVRRMVDFQAGWQEPSLVLLTPYLVSASGAGRALLTTIWNYRRRANLPHRPALFLLAVIGIACGVPLGLAAHTPGAVPETMNWLVPVLFGGYVATAVKETGEIESAVVSTFAKVALVVGLYSLYQFFQLPPWDADWMVNSEMTSIGSAEALSVRVFSTMHSPGVLGYFIFFPIVFWLATPRLRTLIPACLASVALLLSQVRSAWAALAIAAMLVVVTMRMTTGVRVLLLAFFGGLCVTPFLQLPDVSERVNARIETFKDMPNFDTSASARTDGYGLTLDFMVRNPFGAGVGASPQELDIVGVRDSAIISGFVQFGIVGMAVYMMSMRLLVARVWRYYRTAGSPEARGIAAASLGLLCTFLLGIPTAAQPGILTWLVAGIATARAGERHASLLRHSPVPSPDFAIAEGSRA